MKAFDPFSVALVAGVTVFVALAIAACCVDVLRDDDVASITAPCLPVPLPRGPCDAGQAGVPFRLEVTRG